MACLSTALPRGGFLFKETIHRANRAEVDPFIQQSGIHLSGGMIHETLAVEYLSHGLPFVGREGSWPHSVLLLRLDRHSILLLRLDRHSIRLLRLDRHSIRLLRLDRHSIRLLRLDRHLMYLCLTTLVSVPSCPRDAQCPTGSGDG
jgi:hypothetical protein